MEQVEQVTNGMVETQRVTKVSKQPHETQTKKVWTRLNAQQIIIRPFSSACDTLSTMQLAVALASSCIYCLTSERYERLGDLASSCIYW